MIMTVKAGVVLVTEFVEPNNAVFKNYINYITRSNAVRNENIDKYVIPSLDKDLQDFNGYIDYMGNSKKTTELFTKSKERLSLEEKSELQHIFQKAQDNGSLMWQTVISFDNRWLIENNLLDSKTNLLNESKIKEYCRGSIEKMLQSEGMDKNSLWSAAIHYNTDNIHIHVATVQPMPCRAMKVLKTVQVQNSWLREKGIITEDIMNQVEFGEKIKVHNSQRKGDLYLNLLNDVLTQLKQDTQSNYKFGDYILINPNGSIDLTYYGDSTEFPPMIKFIGKTVSQKGKFKQSSIDSAKSFIVNRALTQSKNNQRLNDLIKIIFVKDLKETALNNLKNLPELHRLYDDIIDKLPADKKLWQYNRNVLNPVRKDIDHFVDSWIKKYHESDFQELLQVLKKEEKIYQKAYGGQKNNFVKNQIHDLYARLGNIVLKNIKELLKEGFVPDRIPEDQLEESFQDIAASIEKQYEKNYEKKEYGSSGSPASFKYSKEYKLARKYLYGTNQIKQDQKKAFILLIQEAKKGNLLAKYDLAYCYDKGIGCTQSSETAFSLYQDVLSELENEADKLIDSHNEKEKSKVSYLNYRIGKMYYYGQGTEINYEKAFRYFSLGEDQGLNSVFSKYYLGKMYENGDFVKQDETKAFEYYLAASASSPFAAFKTAHKLLRLYSNINDINKVDHIESLTKEEYLYNRLNRNIVTYQENIEKYENDIKTKQALIDRATAKNSELETNKEFMTDTEIEEVNQKILDNESLISDTEKEIEVLRRNILEEQNKIAMTQEHINSLE